MTLPPQPTVPNRKLAARQARTARIRRTIVACTVALFIAMFATIYVQMASGNDPVLGSTTTVASTSASSDSSSASTASDDSSSASSDDTSDSGAFSDDSSSASSTPSAVTTQQS